MSERLVSGNLDQERLDVAARVASAQHRRTREHLAFLPPSARLSAPSKRGTRPSDVGTGPVVPLLRMR
jgi:hypothetical protein